MARIERDDVLHVARLARLSLSDEEVETFTAQLGVILDHAGRIDALDTTDVPPTAHPVDVGNVWRDDEPADCLPVEVVLALAPEAEAGKVKVPPPA
jgi:aspartyl-tRNA(Asn)/glutamyl-tRNA(Gln) amidotransferase subunit C